MSGPKRKMIKQGVWVCPMCDHIVTSHHSLKNGAWTFEPAEHFGFDDPEGMVCAEWGSNHLWVYYHSPEDLDRGEVDE